MEIMKKNKHTCKLCSRRFSNGRALGGHMRSHVVSVATAASTPSVSTTSSAPVSVSYVLRENPKRSVKLSHPEYFSSPPSPPSPADHGGSSIVQDQESDAESSPPRRPRRRRSNKRRRRQRASPASSGISDASTELEDVAMSLIMLSRDTWVKVNPIIIPDPEPSKGSNKGSDKERTRFECTTCRKVFRSYQALGGHRAGFKNGKSRCSGSDPTGIGSDSVTNDNVDKGLKPGLNGSHPHPVVGFIDLNLPPPVPVEEEFEMSAVYDDGEFDRIKSCMIMEVN